MRRFAATLTSLGCVAAACAIALAAAGCAPGTSTGTRQIVRVTERDFRISAPRRVAAGDAVIRVTNHGPDAHELIVIRTDDGHLPFRGDDLTVDEDAVERSELGALEPGAPHSVRDLDVHLTPGRYVLICNMSGHYLGGMRTTLVVR